MASHPADARSRSLRQNRDFSIFWAGQATASFAESFIIIAIPLLVLDLTGSVARMGLITACFGLGRLIAGLVAGAVVDRVDRRKLMIWCDIGRGALYLVIPLVWWVSSPQLWLIYAVVVVASMMAMFFEVSYITAVGNLVDRDQIIDANGRLHATYAACMAIGPTMAGLLTGRFGANNAIAMVAVFYGVSAVSLSLIRFRPRAASREHPGKLTLGTLFGGLVTGGRIIARDPLFRSLAIFLSVIAFFGTGVLDLFIYHLREDLGQSDFAIGLVFGVASLGSLAGGVLVGRIRRRFGFGAIFAGGFALQGLAMLGVGLAPVAAAVAGFATFYTFGESIRGISTMTIRQEVTPDHLLGRVTAAFWMCFNVPGPIGAAVITALAERTSTAMTLSVAAAITLTLAVSLLFTPIFQRTPEVAAADRFAGYAAELDGTLGAVRTLGR